MSDQPPQPATPLDSEDSLYQAIVGEYLGLQRAGVDPAGAALICAAHLVMVSRAAAAQQQASGGV